MKKIVGIIAAVAMAASLFAFSNNPNLSAEVRFGHAGWQNNWDHTSDAAKNDLFSYSKGGSVELLKLNPNNGKLSLSVDLGIVGGSMNACADNGTIWFKPFFGNDLLKVTVTDNLNGAGDGLCGGANFYNEGTLGQLTQYSGGGYQIDSKPADNFKLGAAFVGNSWTSGGYKTNFWMAYEDGDSLGKLAFIFSAQNKFDTLRIGAGWTKGFGSVTPILNVVADIAAGDFNTLTIEPTVKGNVDALSWSVYAPVVLYIPGFEIDGYKPFIGIDACVDYKIDDSGALKNVWFKAGAKGLLTMDLLADMKFEVGVKGDITSNTNWSFRVIPTIKKAKGSDLEFTAKFGPDVGGNYGGMSWDMAVVMEAGKDLFKVDVPVTFAISF